MFQVCLPEEVNADSSTAKRSQITGHLLVTMPKVKTAVDHFYYVRTFFREDAMIYLFMRHYLHELLFIDQVFYILEFIHKNQTFPNDRLAKLYVNFVLANKM